MHKSLTAWVVAVLVSGGVAGCEEEAAVTSTGSVARFGAPVARPAASILPATVTSCAVIDDTACQQGTTRKCSLYDAKAKAWAAKVPPMTFQAYTFERFYDRYHKMNGQCSDVDFTQAVLAGTAESEWSKDKYFKTYDGIGDASGWTGTALWGAAARYQSTGTKADYARMRAMFSEMMLLYEATGVKGMLARSHFAMLEKGAPHPVGHWGKAISKHRVGDGSSGHYVFPMPAAVAKRMPAYYQGTIDIGGKSYKTVPRVMTDASRDMYVRSLPGVLLAHDMLGQGKEEDRLRALVKTHMVCTLNRLKRGRIINLQKNADIIKVITSYFGGGGVLKLDPGDMDFTKLNELPFYVMEQPDPDYPKAFDATCPTGPPTKDDPKLVLDAADPQFLIKLLELVGRESRKGPVPIAWSMHVHVRPADLLFVMQWGMVAHYLTGDERYAKFVADLIKSVPFEKVMGIWGAFQLPKYCAPHFAPSISYPSLYNVISRLDRVSSRTVWSTLAKMARTEAKERWDGSRGDAFFGILYGRMVDKSVDPEVAAWVAKHVALLGTYGMNPKNKLEPDRSYPRNFVDKPDPTVPLESIAKGDPQWKVCEEPVVVMGIPVPPAKIDGIPVRSVKPLPLSKRIGGTMLWQMDPWMVKREYGGVGMDTQWPMIGMFVPYWIARADGWTTEGANLALAWRDTGTACK